MLRYVSWVVTSKHVGLHRYFLILCAERVPIRCRSAQSMELQEVDRRCINMLPEAFHGISRSIVFGLVARICIVCRIAAFSPSYTFPLGPTAGELSLSSLICVFP
jgi:hypothetical protein